MAKKIFSNPFFKIVLWCIISIVIVGVVFELIPILKKNFASAALLSYTGQFIIGGSSSASLTASAVCDPGGNICNNTLTSRIGLRAPFDLEIDNLYAAQGSAPASGDSCTFTVRKSAGCTSIYTSTSLTCTIQGDGSGKISCQDATNSAAVSAGDCIQLLFTEVQVGKSGGCSGFANWGFRGTY